MSLPQFNAPVNIAICQSPGTIFSSGSGSSGGSGPTYTFANIGSVGAGVLGSVLGNNIQFYRLLNGKNTTATPNAAGITLDTPDLAYDSSAPSTSPIVGLNGVSLNGKSVLATLNALLYPIRPPVISLSLPQNIYEYGDTTGIVVNWAVTMTDEPILTISVGGQSIPVTGTSQNGTITLTKSGNSNLVVNMQVTTATKTVNVSSTDVVARKIRVGYSIKDGIVVQILDSDINSLQNQFFYQGSIPTQALTVPQNNYLVIEIPTAIDPNWAFKINGFINNAWNLVRTNAYVNSFGYSETVNVWVSQSFATGPILLDLIAQ